MISISLRQICFLTLIIMADTCRFDTRKFVCLLSAGNLKKFLFALFSLKIFNFDKDVNTKYICILQVY